MRAAVLRREGVGRAVVGFRENQAGEGPGLWWMKVGQGDEGPGKMEPGGWDQPAPDRVPAGREPPAPHTGNGDSGGRAGEPGKGVLTPPGAHSPPVHPHTFRPPRRATLAGGLQSSGENGRSAAAGLQGEGREGGVPPKCGRRHPSSLWAGAMWQVPSRASGPHPGVTCRGGHQCTRESPQRPPENPGRVLGSRSSKSGGT